MKKVNSGDPLVVPAGTYNAFVDAARSNQQRLSETRQARPGFRQADIVAVKNASGADRERFDVLGISGPLWTPGDAPEAFRSAPAFTGVTPAAGHKGRFVVLLEPVAAGEVGRAVAAGVCVAKVDVADEAHGYADAAEGVAANLASGTSGSAGLLWKESGTGVKWALVRLGLPIAGESDSPKVLGGSGETADAETWDISNPPAGATGVEFTPFRLYWSGTSGDPVYQFVRTPTYDSLGRLVAVSAEVRTVAFETGPCEV